MKKQLPAISAFLVIIGLGGVAIFLGTRLYTTRDQSISPGAPESVPYAGEVGHCETFAIAFETTAATDEPTTESTTESTTEPTAEPTAEPTESPSPQPTDEPEDTSTDTPTSTPAPTATATVTTSSTQTPTPTATSDDIALVTSTPQSFPTPAPTATPQPELPDAGVSLPTILGVTTAGLLVILSIILAI